MTGKGYDVHQCTQVAKWDGTERRPAHRRATGSSATCASPDLWWGTAHRFHTSGERAPTARAGSRRRRHGLVSSAVYSCHASLPEFRRGVLRTCVEKLRARLHSSRCNSAARFRGRCAFGLFYQRGGVELVIENRLVSAYFFAKSDIYPKLMPHTTL
jgi:hypothetical protein